MGWRKTVMYRTIVVRCREYAVFGDSITSQDHAGETMNAGIKSDTMPVRDPEIQALLDRQALHDLAMRYAQAIDRRDRELLLSVYHEDAIDHHGTMFEGSPKAFADWQP